MKLKPLVAIFTYEQLVKTAEREGWRLPTLKEIKGSGHSGWVSDTPPELDPIERPYYNAKLDKVQFLNNVSFKMASTVVKVPCTYASTTGRNVFTTSCGEVVLLEPEYKYCPYCGREILRS